MFVKMGKNYKTCFRNTVSITKWNTDLSVYEFLKVKIKMKRNCLLRIVLII